MSETDRPDYPNKQVLGLDPPWVEGQGGGGKQRQRTPARRPQPKAGSRAEPTAPPEGSAPATKADE